MSKVIILCGKIAAGKSTYAKQLINEADGNAILLATDDIMVQLMPDLRGKQYDDAVLTAQNYLNDRALDIINTGVDVVLESSCWRRSERDAQRRFFEENGIPVELHYVNLDDETWRRHIEKRNSEAEPGTFYVDKGLLAKCIRVFEAPEPDEVDLYVYNLPPA